MSELESLLIYNRYLDLIYYVHNILNKYPKTEKHSLVSEIKKTVYNGMEYIIMAQKEFNRKDRMKELNKLDVNLKMLKVLVRLSHKKKYINNKNYAAWSRKITDISNLMGGWMKSCLGH